VSVTDLHLATGVKADTWKLRNPHFNYDEFIATCASIIVRDGRTPVLTAKWADIASLVDQYTSQRLFKSSTDFSNQHNYKVLAYQPLQDFVTSTLKGVIYEKLGQPHFELQGTWRKLSDVPRILVREEHSVPAAHCIYARMPYSRNFGGLERDVMGELLDSSVEVLAWCKLQRRHGLTIAYRDPVGILRTYEVDFIIRTAARNYILETKSDKDMLLPSVGLKARAAKHWCESICGASGCPLDQSADWEDLLLPQSLFEANRNASFQALLPLMRQARDGVVAAEQGALFV
jgi:type III restriction enzyme